MKRVRDSFTQFYGLIAVFNILKLQMSVFVFTVGLIRTIIGLVIQYF